MRINFHSRAESDIVRRKRKKMNYYPKLHFHVEVKLMRWSQKRADITQSTLPSLRNAYVVCRKSGKEKSSSVDYLITPLGLLRKPMAPPELSNYGEDRRTLPSKSINTGIRMVELQPNADSSTHNGMSRASEWINFVDTPIFGVDKHAIIHTWNRKAHELTGLSFDQVWNKSLENFVTTVQPFRTSLQDALNGKEVDPCVVEFKTTQEPTSRRIQIKPSAQRDHQGNVVGLICFASRDEKSVNENGNHVANETCHSAVRVANELLRLFNKANTPIFGIDADGDVNEWNEKMVSLTEFTKQEALDHPLEKSLLVLNSKQSFREIIDKALRGKETSNYEVEFRTKSNEVRCLLLNLTTRRDLDDKIVGVVGIAQDMTEMAQQDRAVAAVASELRQLVDTANAPIFGVDIEGRVNEWNDKTAEITGFSGDEAFGKCLIESFIVPKLRNSVQDVLENALRGRGTSNYELEFRTKSNEIRFLLVNATTRRDAENNIVGVLAVAQDVTEAAKHDRAVASMANELRQLIDTANAPIFGIDVDGDVNEWNDKTAEITGYTKEEAFDCPLVEKFIVPSCRNSVQEVMESALQGRASQNYEIEFRTKSGTIRHLLVNATTRRDAENNIVGVVGVAQDVTEAVQRDRAVAGMANELRQLIDSANAPIFGIDADGNVNEWNNKTAEITGYTKEEAFDEHLVETFIVPSFQKSVQEVLDKALRGEETSNYDLEFKTKTGEIRYLLLNATTRRDPENNIVGGEFIPAVRT